MSYMWVDLEHYHFIAVDLRDLGDGVTWDALYWRSRNIPKGMRRIWILTRDQRYRLADGARMQDYTYRNDQILGSPFLLMNEEEDRNER